MKWETLFRGFALFSSVLCFTLIYSPLLFLVWLSFHEVSYTGISKWTVQNYVSLLQNSALLDPLLQSAVVAFTTALIVVPVAFVTAYLLERSDLKFRKLFELTSLLPLALPELVLGISLLTWFVALGLPLGTMTIALGHTVYAFPFALIVLRTSLKGMDLTLNDAARDLGATWWQLFVRVTLPVLAPSLIAAFLLSMLLSFDDFIVAFFTAGVGADTLPLKLYALMKLSFDPQVYALAVVMMLATAIVVGGALFLLENLVEER